MTLIEELEQAANFAENCDSIEAAARLRKRAERTKTVTDLGDVCAHCDRPPVCIGVYEDSTGQPALACDECCGHGNEDGWCKLLTEYLTGDL